MKRTIDADKLIAALERKARQFDRQGRIDGGEARLLYAQLADGVAEAIAIVERLAGGKK